MNGSSITGILLLGSSLVGCASVPMASLDADIQAKQFVIAPGKSNIYLYRDKEFGPAITMPVALDGQVAGKTASNTYFLRSVDPGRHEVTEEVGRKGVNECKRIDSEI